MPGEAVIRGVFFFMAYAFLGWMIECCYVRVLDGEWVNRGFLHGPFLPVYGFGGVIIIYILQGVSSNPLLLFTASFFLLSLLEYAAGWMLERAFKIKWWDYSQYKFNLSGRVCLLNSLYWGVLGVVVMKLVHPGLAKLASLFSPQRQLMIISLFLFYFFLDLAASLRRAADFGKVIQELEAYAEKLEREIGERQRKYEEKIQEYERNKELYREKWRRGIDEAKAQLLQNLTAQGESLQKKIEQANEDFRIGLRLLKGELAAAANQKERAVKLSYGRYNRDIRQLLARKREASHHRSMRRLLRIFPTLSPAAGRFSARELWLEIRNIVKKEYYIISQEINGGGEEMKKYVCTACGYVYDPEVGDADSGIAPGTAFEDIPEDWVCPLCGVGKDMFEVQE